MAQTIGTVELKWRWAAGPPQPLASASDEATGRRLRNRIDSAAFAIRRAPDYELPVDQRIALDDARDDLSELGRRVEKLVPSTPTGLSSDQFHAWK